MTVNKVAPALKAARDAGLTIVHTPCPEVAQQYAQLDRHTPPTPSPAPDWPPAGFRSRSGEYAVFRGPRSQPPGIGIHWDKLASGLSMSPAIEVREEDFVVATGRQLHDLLRTRKIFHLMYVGFATNWCVLGRDYGIRAMSRRGYNIILLREATTGVEFPDTLETLFTTEIAIREVEQQCGFTASNEDFFEACHGANR